MYGTFIVGCVLLISCTFILFLLKKSRNRKVFWYFCHVWILGGITLGILNIVFQKYDAYTSIYLGIICSCYTYYDNKQNPVSKRTNAYIITSRIRSRYRFSLIWFIKFVEHNVMPIPNGILCKLGLISLRESALFF